MMNTFTYDGKISSDYGLYISGSGTFDAPERDVTKIEIPGKNGTLTLDNRRFKNIPLKYPAFIRKDFKSNAAHLREWLLSSVGYRRLTDTYHPEYYRMARYTGPIEFDMRSLNKAAEFNLEFDCMPQRFLISGETDIEITGTTTIVNPTVFESLPLIRVYGTDGSLTVNNTVINISAIDEYVDLDSELQDAYKGTENKNAYVSQTFPGLKQGANVIDFDGNITNIIIKPRWWTI